MDRHAELESRGLRNIEVTVRYKLGDLPPLTLPLRVRPNDTLKKIKNHIMKSLDVQGKVMYGEHNCDSSPNKRLSEYPTSHEEKFYLTAERKERDLKQHTIKVQLPEELAAKAVKTVDIKVARTTTTDNLKHKLQDECGIPVEEQNIHVLGQDMECQSGANIMQQLPSAKSMNLEVKWQRKEASPTRPSKVRRSQSLKSSCSLASGTPYAVKLSRRNSVHEYSPIHPKSLTKVMETTGTYSAGRGSRLYELCHFGIKMLGTL